MRILIAEDNAANRMIARSILEREGHEVHCFANGLEAVAAAREIRPEIALLDILMPVMDGVRTSRHLRQILQDTPIIALTSYDSPADVSRYLRAGFDGLIAKPLQPGDLEAVMVSLGLGAPAVLRKAQTGLQNAKALPLLNWQIIEDGPGSAPRELIAKILTRYRKTVWDAIAEMNAALPGCLRSEPDDVSRFRNALHRFKGASDMIGLARAPYLAGQLRNARPSDLRAGVRTLLQAIQESLPVLHEVLMDPATQGEPRKGQLLAFRQGGALVQMGGEHQAEATHHDKHDRTAV